MKRFLSMLIAITLLATFMPLSLVQTAFAMTFDAGADQTITLGEEVSIEAEASDLDGAAVGVASTFDWGDGNLDIVTAVAGADHFSLDEVHTYAAVGTYTLTITATEIDGSGTALSEETDTLTITVEEAAVCEDDEYESNDDLEDAYELTDGSDITASLCDEDRDAYKVSLTAGQTMTVEAVYTYTDDLLGVMLADENGDEMQMSDAMLGSVSPSEGEEVTETVSLTAEDDEYYYIGVLTQDARDIDSYTLTVSVEDAPYADLYVSDLYLSGANLYYTLGNSGTADVDVDAGGGLLLQVDGVTSVNYSWLTLADTNFLSAGGTTENNIILSSYGEGDHTLKIYVDHNEMVDESDEENNVVEFDFTVDADGNVTEAVKSDLVVTDIEIDDIGSIYYTIENQGEGDVEEGTTVEASVKVLWDGAEYMDETVVLTDQDDTSFMSAGGSSTYEFTSLGWGGDYTITVNVDSSEQVDEENEDNNSLEEDESWSGFSSSHEEDDETETEETEDEESSTEESDEETTEEDGDVELASDEEDGTGGGTDDDSEEDDSSSELADAADEEIDCTSPFEDTEGSFAEKAICLLYEAGTVSGKTETLYEPESNVTRAEFLKMIMLNAGEAVEAVDLDEDYTDVTDEGKWYYEYVTYGTSIGVVEGYDDGSFGPNDPISRSEAVVMLFRMAGIDSYEASDVPEFDDVDYSEDSWYAFAINGAVDLGIVEGYEDNTFLPSEDINRAEAAVVVRRAWYVWYAEGAE